MYQLLFRFLRISIIILKALFKSKGDLLLENIALRQQLSTYLIKKTKPKLTDLDRSFWVALKQVFNKWTDFLIIVKPQTLVDWQECIIGLSPISLFGIPGWFLSGLDKGYEGSTYLLYYYAEEDSLVEYYYQAKMNRTYKVVFIRKPQ